MESSHQIFCGFVVEAADAVIVESSDGFAVASFDGATPVVGDMQLCGYMNAPQSDRGLNNSLGYSIGSSTATYRKRGSRNPTLSLTLRGGGALDLLTKANRVSGELPWLSFFVGVPDVWTDLYRFCKIGNINIQAKESAKGEAAEIEVTLQVEATAIVPLAEPIASDDLDLLGLQKDLTTALCWHDVRTFKLDTIDDEDEEYNYDLRKAVSGFSAQINHNIERKNERNDFGDDSPLSNTSYHLLEHNVNVSGEISLHERFDETWLTAEPRAQNWGDIVLTLGDWEGTKLITLKLIKTFPQNYTSEGVEAGAQLSHTLPYLAHDYELTAVVPEPRA